MRGKRIISAVLLGALCCAQFLFLTVSLPAKVQAEWELPFSLPGDMNGLMTRFEAHSLAENSGYELLKYYINNVRDKNPANWVSYGRSGNLRDMHFNIYSDTYNAVSAVNDTWTNNILEGLRKSRYGDLNDRTNDPAKNVAEANKLLNDMRETLKELTIPRAVQMYAGNTLLSRISSDTSARDQIIAQGLSLERFNEMNTNFDVTENTKHLQKPANYASAFQDGGGSLTFSMIYKTPDGAAGWYGDFKLVAEFIMNYPQLSTGEDFTKYQNDVKTLAAQLDANATAVSEAAAKGDVCGDASGINLGLIIRVAFCEMTVAVRDLFVYLLKSSMGLLVTTAGIPAGGTISSTSRLSGTPLLFDGLKNTLFDGRVEDILLDKNSGAVARAAYARVLNFANGGVLLLLIIIALANILQVQINVYSFKKLLPGLVIGLLLANASFLVVRAMLEVSGYVASGLISREEVRGGSASGKEVGPAFMLDQFVGFGTVGGENGTFWNSAKNEPDVGKVFQQFILNIFILIAAVMVLILGFLFAIRSLVFLLLLPLAPLAFIGLYFPPLGGVWKRWWAMVINWTFMPVVAFFWLWLGFMWMASVPAQGSGIFAYLLNYVFGIIMIYMAMKTPFTLAGEAKTVLNKWNDFGKGVGARYTPYGTGLRASKQLKDLMEQKSKNAQAGTIVQGGIAKKLGGGAINTMMAKAKAKADQEKNYKEEEKAKVDAKALEKLSTGLKGYVEGLQNSEHELIRNLGKSLDKSADRYINAVGKVNGFLGHKLGIAGPFGYQAKEAYIRDLKDDATLAKNTANQAVTTAYYSDKNLGIKRAQREFKAESNEFAATKAKTDAKLKAAHVNVSEAADKHGDLLERVNAKNSRINSIKLLTDMSKDDISGLEKDDQGNETAEGKALAEEVRNYHRFNKGIIKASNKHITGKYRDDAEDYTKKEVAEFAVTTGDEKTASSIFSGISPTEPLDAADHADVVSKMMAFTKIIAKGNDVDKTPEAHAATIELLKLVGQAPDNMFAKADIELLEHFRDTALTENDRGVLKMNIKNIKNSKLYKDIVKISTDSSYSYKK